MSEPRTFRSRVGRYLDWLHLRWPAGKVEPMPALGPAGETDVPGLRVAGDLAGIPLLKYAADSAVRATRGIAEELRKHPSPATTLDLVIVGGGVAGLAAALEAKQLGLRFTVVEAASPFSTVHNFPLRKPIFTYPQGFKPAGALDFAGQDRESLLQELDAARTQAGITFESGRVTDVQREAGHFTVRLQEGGSLLSRAVLLTIGRSGNYRRLGVPGEDSGVVTNRLHDPADYRGSRVLVVGGGDSAVEAAIALADAGASVVLSYRGESLDRPKPENREALARLAKEGRIDLKLGTKVRSIQPQAVELTANNAPSGVVQSIPAEKVFVLIGREAPLTFLRKAGVRIQNEWRASTWISFGLFIAFSFFLYLWKASSGLNTLFREKGWFPFAVPEQVLGVAGSLKTLLADPTTVPGTLLLSLREPGFYYSLAYCLCVVCFGIDRVLRKPTPYIRFQTATLAAIQLIPLFILPYILLPWLGHLGHFDSGWGRSLADALFPISEGSEHGREYWRAFGLILAWPLFIWNLFTEQPLWAWLVISCVQTFVIIPLIVRRWGKGAYCGWICSCGALAETLGDRHRHKMPHGPRWNRLNLIGQVVLLLAFLLFLARAISWIAPQSALGGLFAGLYYGLLSGWHLGPLPLNYYTIVDIFLAGIVGVGAYFWFSGRVWCRFACPLAALMHIYARFSQFRIFSEKKKCISCNLCTSVCHQGIDIMAFANRGLPMEDPQCVRCSACVQTCPTGVLAFGYLRSDGSIAFDKLAARMPDSQP